MEMHRETIYQLLLLKLTGSINETDEVYVNTLIENDPETASMWHNIQQDFATPALQHTLQTFDTEALIDDVKETINKRRQQRNRYKGILLMVVIVTAIGISVYPPVQKKPEQENRLVTIVVPAGKDRQLQLPDGSTIRLNSGSMLQYPANFTDSTREISICGEAFVKVISVSGLPFIVHTQHTTIQVLGTSFNVNSYDTGVVKVSLITGMVKMMTGRQEVLLRPGQKAVAKALEITTTTFDEESELAWLKEKSIFCHQKMRNVTPILEQWYKVKIVFDNPATAEKEVTGNILKSDSLETVLNMLTVICDASYYHQENIIHIR
jgi:transmembrane sensor